MRIDGVSAARAGRWPGLAGLLFASFAAGACGGPPAPPTREALEEATFLTLDGGTITLGGGMAVGDGNVRHELLTTAAGDLDFDSEPDAVAVLAAQRGRERFLSLHAILSDGGELVDVSARLLGDRIEARRLAVSDGMIRLDVRIRRPGEPVIVPPSVDLARHFMLTNRGLVPILLTEVTEGEGKELSLHTHEWELASFDEGHWAADLGALDEPVKLRFLAETFEGPDVTGQMSGFVGCNRLFGSFRTQQAEALQSYGLATTRKRCRGGQADFEQRLFAALGSVEAFSFSGDQLVLALMDGAIRFKPGGRLVRLTPEAIEPEPSGDGGRSP